MNDPVRGEDVGTSEREGNGGMSADEKRYTLEEARKIIRQDAIEKVCGIGHDLMVQTTVVDRPDGAILGRREPTMVICKYCYQEWDVVPRG